MTEVQQIVPDYDWLYLLLGGDWNISLYEEKDPPREALFTICKSMEPHIHSCDASGKEKTIIFFVVGSQVVVKSSGCDIEISANLNKSYDIIWGKIY